MSDIPALAVVDAARHVIAQWEVADDTHLSRQFEGALRGLRAALNAFTVIESKR